MDCSNNNCNMHELIVDYIDIDPDRSKQIVYCTNCLVSYCYTDIEIYRMAASSKPENLLLDSDSQTHSTHE